MGIATWSTTRGILKLRMQGSQRLRKQQEMKKFASCVRHIGQTSNKPGTPCSSRSSTSNWCSWTCRRRSGSSCTHSSFSFCRLRVSKLQRLGPSQPLVPEVAHQQLVHVHGRHFVRHACRDAWPRRAPRFACIKRTAGWWFIARSWGKGLRRRRPALLPGWGTTRIGFGNGTGGSFWFLGSLAGTSVTTTSGGSMRALNAAWIISALFRN